MKLKQIIIFILLSLSILFGQLYIPADPFYLINSEYDTFNNTSNSYSLITRPIIIDNNNDTLAIKYHSDIFFNSNMPNLENTSDRWVGKGTNIFTSVNISINRKYFFVSIEPFMFYSQNLDYEVPDRYPIYSTLNDNQPFNNKPYTRYDLRETQFYLKHNELAIGWSNANMWWGDGLHNSLMMTNNTTGFGHLFFGTIREKQINNFGIDFKYILSKLNRFGTYKPYYNAFALFTSHNNSRRTLTLGVVKSVMLGGEHPAASDVSPLQAAFSIFNDFGINIGKSRGDVIDDWTNDDNIITGYFSYIFKREKLKIFFEFGRNDWIWDIRQFLVFPENSMAFIIGMRKYDLFYKNIFFGIEYLSTRSNRLNHINDISSFYEKPNNDFYSYNGRKFAAHSGYDADDLFITIGWINENIHILQSINFERHGLENGTSENGYMMFTNSLNQYLPESKIEYKSDIKFNIKEYIINIYLEMELQKNIESINKSQNGFVIWIGIEREFDFSKKIFKEIWSKID